MGLKINHITKSYKEKTALDNIDWEIQPEKIYGLLGRNGAGKSTLLNIIANRSFSTAGSVTLDGQPVTDNETALNRIYLMSEDNMYPGNIRVRNCFDLTTSFFGGFDTDLAQRMMKAFGLDEKTYFNRLSTGYRSITKLIMALSVPCDYIFLDEPVLGLDANHRELFYDFLLETYSERPRTFVISTHLIEEVANLLEEVIIIDQGKVLRKAETETIQQEGKIVSGPKEVVAAFTKNLQVIGQDELGGLVNVYVEGVIPPELPANVSVAPLNLQAYFVHLTNKQNQGVA